MVWGAVVIGRPVGPDMIRPFTRFDFKDLVEKCGLILPIEDPVEVAYPHSLNEPEKYAYQEGVLINVYGGDREGGKEFSEYVGSSLIAAAQKAEELWAEYALRRRMKPWGSDLDYQKVCNVYLGKGKGEMDWEPCMKVLETYSDDKFREKYLEIVTDLSGRTRDARLKRYEAEQSRKFADDVRRVSDF